MVFGLPYGLLVTPPPEQGFNWTAGGRAPVAVSLEGTRPGEDGSESGSGSKDRWARFGYQDTAGPAGDADHGRMLLARRVHGTAVHSTAGLGNLLVSVAVSSTHVGFNPLRIEPTYMVLGQAAGTAAALAIEGSTGVHDIDMTAL